MMTLSPKKKKNALTNELCHVTVTVINILLPAEINNNDKIRLRLHKTQYFIAENEKVADSFVGWKCSWGFNY